MPIILKIGTLITSKLSCLGLIVISILSLLQLFPDSPFATAVIGVWSITLIAAMFLLAPAGRLRLPRAFVARWRKLTFALGVCRFVASAYLRVQRVKLSNWWASHRSLSRLVIDAPRAMELAPFQGFTSATMHVPVVIGFDGRALIHPSVVRSELWPSIKIQNPDLFAKAEGLREGALMMGKRHYASGDLVECHVLLHGLSRLGSAERAALYALQAKIHSLGARCDVQVKVHDSRVDRQGRSPRHPRHGALATELLGAIGGAAVVDSALILGLSAAPLVIDFSSSVVGFFVGALFTAFIWARLARSSQHSDRKEE